MTADVMPRAVAYMTGALSERVRPRDVGRKFDASGRALPFPGNTFLCHVPQESVAHAALVAAQETLRAMPGADRFAWLPPASFHMTVFEGVADPDRDPAAWPAGLSPRLRVQAVTEEFLHRTEGLALPQRFRVRPTTLFGATTLGLTGATEEDAGTLWRARSLLREATGIRKSDFIEYRFHITLGYILEWLDEPTALRVADICTAAFEKLVTRAPLIELGPVEFCTFETMLHFEPLVRFE